jgi:HlyD family secretion protein
MQTILMKEDDVKHYSKITRPIVLVLGVLLLAGCGSKPSPSPTPVAPAGAATNSSSATMGSLSALGTIRPAQTLQLSFGASGPVRTMTARLGVQVQAGDLLAGLDTAALELELQNARQEVDICQAQLDNLLDGPGAWLVARAEAEHAQQVAQAEIALQMAKWRLEQVALTRSQDALATTQEEHQKALDRPWEPKEVRESYAKAVQLAEQEVQIAHAQEEVARATAHLRQAELAVTRLELQLQGAELRAPFDGAISAVHLRPGEWGTPGVPAVYTLTIELEPTALSLRSGMTVQVEIITE